MTEKFPLRVWVHFPEERRQGSAKAYVSVSPPNEKTNPAWKPEEYCQLTELLAERAKRVELEAQLESAERRVTIAQSAFDSKRSLAIALLNERDAERTKVAKLWALLKRGISEDTGEGFDALVERALAETDGT